MIQMYLRLFRLQAGNVAYSKIFGEGGRFPSSNRPLTVKE
jgi:hypothetical protein